MNLSLSGMFRQIARLPSNRGLEVLTSLFLWLATSSTAIDRKFSKVEQRNVQQASDMRISNRDSLLI